MPFSLFDLLPMPPWEGPPLPRFLQIYWPPFPVFNNTTNNNNYNNNNSLSNEPQTTYTNEEAWEIKWSAEGLPVKVIVHRNAKRNG